jgi:hypothetical protein
MTHKQKNRENERKYNMKQGSFIAKWSSGTKSRRRIAFVAALVGTLAVPAQRAVATLVNFQNEYYVSSSSEFTSLFGTPSSGSYGTAGIYQETQTTPGSVIVTKLATSGAPGEFVQNTAPTAPNASQGLQLFGWGGSYNNGTPLANNVYNSGNPFNGTVLYMQYKTGVTGGLFGNGTTTAFTFNDIAFRGATTGANLTFTLEGYLGGVLKDSAVLTVTGNTFSTFTENWQNVDTVEIMSTTQNSVNWGSGTLYLGAVDFNNPVPVPEASTMIAGALLLLPFGASTIRLFANRHTSASKKG